MDILQEIVAYKRLEIAKRRSEVPFGCLLHDVERAEMRPTLSFKAALQSSKTGIIAEFKRKSPSKGWINQGASVEQVTLGYQSSGAACLSILTDEAYFGGSNDYITRTKNNGVCIPVLYKNFVVDEYQLLEARLSGADAVLLIAACLDKRQCADLLHKANDLGLEALLEMHNEREVDYADLQPQMCGINNRCLGTFRTDVEASFRLAERLPEDSLWVSESGLSNPETVIELRRRGYQGFLMGERFMREKQPAEALKAFVEDLENGLSSAQNPNA